MNKKNCFKNLLFCFLIALGYTIVLRISGYLLKSFFSITDETYYFVSFINDIVVIIYIIVILISTKKLFILKEKGIGLLNGFKVGGFLVIYLCFSLVGNVCSSINEYQFLPLHRIIWFTLDMFIGVGLAEEIIFRGIIQNMLYDCFEKDSRKVIYISVIISSTIFGALHLSNIFSGASIQGACVQAISAFTIGLYFSAIYVRCNNIWVLVILHGFNDFVALIQSGIWGTETIMDTISNYGIEKIISVILFTSLSCYILRKKRVFIE